MLIRSPIRLPKQVAPPTLFGPQPQPQPASSQFTHFIRRPPRSTAPIHNFCHSLRCSNLRHSPNTRQHIYIPYNSRASAASIHSKWVSTRHSCTPPSTRPRPTCPTNHSIRMSSLAPAWSQNHGSQSKRGLISSSMLTPSTSL